MKDIRYLTRWGFGLAFLLLFTLHLIKPEFDIFKRHLSEYANGKLGVLMILAFLFFAFGLLGLAFQSYRSISGKKLKVAFSFLFVVTAFSSVILGLFPINLLGTPSSTSSIIHLQTAPILLISVMGGLSFFSLRLKFEEGHEKLFKSSSLIGIFTWISLGFLVYFYNDPNYQGLFQRIFALFLWIWLMHVSLKLT